MVLVLAILTGLENIVSSISVFVIPVAAPASAQPAKNVFSVSRMPYLMIKETASVDNTGLV